MDDSRRSWFYGLVNHSFRVYCFIESFVFDLVQQNVDFVSPVLFVFFTDILEQRGAKLVVQFPVTRYPLL